MFSLLDRNDDGKVVKDEMPRRKFRHGDGGDRRGDRGDRSDQGDRW